MDCGEAEASEVVVMVGGRMGCYIVDVACSHVALVDFVVACPHVALVDLVVASFPVAAAVSVFRAVAVAATHQAEVAF